MKTNKGYSMKWFLAMLLAAVVAGCSSSGGDGGVVSTDTTAPVVSFTYPLDAATGVARNTSISATFSEDMIAATIDTASVTLKQGTTPVSGTVTYVGTTAIIKPASNLAASTVYTATITTGARDLAGNALASSMIWSFTTGTTTDTTAPTVNSTIPLDTATGVSLNTVISAKFSEVMSAASITAGSFTVKQGTTPVAGTVTCVGTTATFKPASNLAANTVYTATITTAASDMAGNAMSVNKVWTFTTGTTTAAGPAPVLLGASGDYVILAKTAISTTGTTSITGNIGLSPAAASYITGFTLTLDGSGCFSTTLVAPFVTGNIYAADYNTGSCTTPIDLTTAVLDMMIAYTDAAGRAPDYTELGAGNIGGMTLYPGTYKWSTGVLIPSDVTLSGGANDVWIFEIAGDITQSSATSVNLIGGAQARNVFWQVAGGTGVAIGTTAHFEGIILAAKAITVNTGATVEGRLLSQTAVTLKANEVAEP